MRYFAYNIVFVLSLLFFYTPLKSQNLPSFLGTPIKWTTLIQNETESSEPDIWSGIVWQDNINPTFTLDLGEQTIIAYEQNIDDGWILVNIQSSTGEINWKRAVTKNTDGTRSYPMYMYQSSSTTIDLVGYEMILDQPNPLGEISYLFRAKISLSDGNILQRFCPKEEEGGTFIFNVNGVLSRLVHHEEENSFFLSEFFGNPLLDPIGTWKLSEADSSCHQIRPEEYLPASNTAEGGHGYQYQVRGLANTPDEGYLLFLQERDISDLDNPTNYIELAKLNENKELQWKKDIKNEVGLGGNFVPSTDSGYMIFGKWDKEINANNIYYISKFDSNGDFVWRKTLEAGSKLQYGTQLHTEDGYLLGGVRNEEECFLIKSDEDGNLSEVASWKVNGNTEKISLSQAVELQNGNIMVAIFVYEEVTITNPIGETVTSNIGKNYLGLIEKEDLTTDIEGVKEHDTILKLSPNPSNDGFVTLSFPQIKKGIICFYNPYGQIVKTIAIQNEQTKSLNVKDLVGGLYFVKWEGEDKSIATQSLFIQH